MCLQLYNHINGKTLHLPFDCPRELTWGIPNDMLPFIISHWKGVLAVAGLSKFYNRNPKWRLNAKKLCPQTRRDEGRPPWIRRKHLYQYCRDICWKQVLAFFPPIMQLKMQKEPLSGHYGRANKSVLAPTRLHVCPSREFSDSCWQGRMTPGLTCPYSSPHVVQHLAHHFWMEFAVKNHYIYGDWAATSPRRGENAEELFLISSLSKLQS